MPKEAFNKFGKQPLSSDELLEIAVERKAQEAREPALAEVYPGLREVVEVIDANLAADPSRLERHLASTYPYPGELSVITHRDGDDSSFKLQSADRKLDNAGFPEDHDLRKSIRELDTALRTIAGTYDGAREKHKDQITQAVRKLRKLLDEHHAIVTGAF